MNKEDFFQLGSIAKLHGFKGEVSLFLDVTNPEEYTDLETVFVDMNGFLTPFFIDNVKLKNKGFITVKFKEVDDEATAKKLLKKEIYLPLDQLRELDDVSFYDHEVLGYEVIDSIKGSIGKVTNVIDIASNPLMQTEINGKEVLLPIFDGLVKKVDRKKMILYIEAPEGLIDLYL
jgi:16S rRNA processing protein RimM